MTGDRMRRVNEAVREVLSGAITSELKDPRVGFVTVTAVETSPDLRHARVFVSVLGNPGERRRSLQALDNAHGFLQRRVGSELRMKHTPQLQFVYDDTPERGMRITELLELEDSRPPAPVEDSHPPAPVADSHPPAPVEDSHPPAPDHREPS